jgi:hypothetical protein
VLCDSVDATARSARSSAVFAAAAFVSAAVARDARSDSARRAWSPSDDAVPAATEASSITPDHVVVSWSIAPSW